MWLKGNTENMGGAYTGENGSIGVQDKDKEAMTNIVMHIF